MYFPPKNDPEYSRKRLDAIMSRRRLRFNPYSVSDRCLLEIVNSIGWGNELDLTQILIIHFSRLRETDDYRNFDGIFIRIGNGDEDVFISASALAYGTKAHDSFRIERSLIGKKPLRNNDDVAALVGKTVFVSHIIRGTNIFGHYKGAYRMHKLTGCLERDARTIREAMCMAKIEMLERMLAYPESRDYLNCEKGIIDYEPRIRAAIDLIRRFPDTPIPED